MKKFFIKLGVVILLMVLTLLIVEKILFLKGNEYSYRLNYVKEHGPEIKTLILGPSQAHNDIIPEIFSDSAFSCAMPGKPAYVDRRFIEKYGHFMPNLKTLIYPIAYNQWRHTVDDKLMSTFRGSVLCRFNKYWDIPVENHSKMAYTSEVYHTKGWVMEGFFFDSPLPCKPTGWEPTPDVPRTEEQLKHVMDDVDYGSDEIKLYTEITKSHARAIAKYCKEHGVRLIVVSPPLYISHIRGISQAGLDNMIEHVKAMIDEYPATEYYDYTFDSRFGDGDFFDYSHLNEQAAVRFTNILRDDCQARIASLAKGPQQSMPIDNSLK